MKNVIIVLIACICCLIPSCERAEVDSIKYDLDSFLPLNPHELFKKIEVILLDSVPDQPINLIENTGYNDNLFYIQDRRRGNLLVYCKTGAFIRTIGSKGRGPGELDDIRDFQINRFTGNIEIMGNPSPSIMIYDTDGNFIKRRNIGNRVLTIDKFYHINSDLTAWLALGEDYKISVYSEKQNQVVHELLLGMDRAFMGYFRFNNPFSHYKDVTYFFDAYSNTIYRFNIDKLEFEVHKKLDFGKHNFNKSLLPQPQEWNVMDLDQRLDVVKRVQKNQKQFDKYFEIDEYSVLNKWTSYIFTRKENNSTLQFNSFADSTIFFIDGVNNNFSYRIRSLSYFDKSLNELMIGKEVYQELEALRLGDKNEERYIIIKYWFK